MNLLHDIAGDAPAASCFAPRHDVSAEPYIIGLVASYFGKTLDDLVGPRRLASVVRARHVAAYLMRTHTALPLAEIGARLGKRDHTTILHAVRTVRAQVHYDQLLRAQVGELALMIERAKR